jgi:hypothetical protein
MPARGLPRQQRSPVSHSKEHAMLSRLVSHLTSLATATVFALAAVTPSAWAQDSKPTPPAQKTPAKPGAQSGPDAAASAASRPTTSPPAEKKPAKPGAQSGPKPSRPASG